MAQQPTATLALIVSMTPRFTATPVATRTPLPTFTYTPSITPIPSDTPIPPSPTEPPPIVGIVASSQTVNVREGPGTAFRAILALNPGTGVTLLGQSEDGDWYNIQMDDGSEGWISSSLLRLQATPTLPPTALPTVDPTNVALGTIYPTALLGGLPVTPTLPSSVLALSQTPDPAATAAPAAQGAQGTAVVNADALNQTATALAGSIVESGVVQTQAADRPVGGPTGGPAEPAATAAGGQPAQVTAAQTVGDILAYCDDPFVGSPPLRNLVAGQYIRIYWSWFARTEQQVNDHVNNANYDVRVNGVTLSAWRQYGLPAFRKDDGNYYKYWYVPFGPLEPGQYTIEYRLTWRQAIDDGFARFGPGTSNPENAGTCTFTVGQ